MLSVRGIHRMFEDDPVLQGINLEISQGEILCLLGASGCGKTTLLRVIAGLEQPEQGDVLLNGQSVLGVPIHARDFGLMFQDFALFPHLNTAENITFGLKMRRVPPELQRKRLQEVLELVGLTGFEQRDVTRLSGGERQRVALARSLAPNPRLLMLDEPLGALDTQLRERLVTELRVIIKQAGVTAIYVTHDQREAFAVADRVALMNAGRLEQVGTPESVYRHPASVFVSRFLGLGNIFLVLSRDSGRVHTALGEFALPETTQAILLHPDGVIPSQGDGEIQGKVTERVFAGRDYSITMALDAGGILTFTIPSDQGGDFIVGRSIGVQINRERIVPLNA